MKKRGRPAAVPDEDILEKLKDLPLFEDNEKKILKKSSDGVWLEAQHLLNFRIKKENLYLRILGNRNNIRDQLKFEENSNEVEVEEIDLPKEVDTESALDIFLTDAFYKPFIRELSTSPVNIMYRWLEQIDAYNDFLRLNNGLIIFTVINCYEFMEKPVIEDCEIDQLSHLALVGQVSDSLFSFWQGISSRIDSAYTNYFLNEFLRENVAAPNQLVTIPSVPIVDAISLAFNHMTMKEYCTDCFEYLIEKQTNLPYCQIAVDIIPIIKNMKEKFDEIFEEDQNNIKEFYIGCFIYLCIIKSFNEFEKTIKEIHTLSTTERYYDSTIVNKESLLKKIKQMNVADKIAMYKRCSSSLDCKVDNSNEFHNFKSSTSILRHFKALIQNQNNNLLTLDSSTLNPYYNPKASVLFIEALSTFPLWSSLVIEGNVSCKLKEKHFTIIEKSLSNDKKIVVQEFLKNQATCLKSDMEIFRKIIKDEREQLKYDRNKECINYSYLNYKENWKGKAEKDPEEEKMATLIDNTVEVTNMSWESNDEIMDISEISQDESIIHQEHNYSQVVSPSMGHSTPAQTNKKRKYTNPEPAVAVLYNKPDISKPKMGIIKNGNRMKPKSLKNVKYVFENSSVMDSISELLIHSMTEYKFLYDRVKTYIDNKNATLFISTIFHLMTNHNILKYYADRLNILLEIGQLRGKLESNIFCPQDIKYYFDIFMDSIDGFTENMTCQNCNKYTVHHMAYAGISEDTVITKTIEKFFNETSKLCMECQQAIYNIFNFKGYIAIHLEREKIHFKIKDLQTQLEISEQLYFLAGLISFEKSEERTHYIAYVRSARGIWKKRDSMSRTEKEEKVNSNVYLNIGLLLYVKQ